MVQLTVDGLGWAYLTLTIVWTAALVGGMMFLWIHRELPSVRMRRLPLLFAGLLLLHGYGAVCLITRIIAPTVSCTAEFFVMSIYLPFGIAIFQAANSQFLHVATRQKRYAHMSSLSDQEPLKEEKANRLTSSRWPRILRAVERANKIDRLMVRIGIGMAVQLFVTLFVYFGSKKFHPGYGLWDWEVQGTQSEVRAKCSRGWEWWLSIVWQFFWAWIYAPYLLWKTRGIRDAHGWRLQTTCCCLAGLPASPLWLTALYAPQMAPINNYFIPPNWFSVCILIMECIAIGFPIVQIHKGNSLRQETLDAIAAWEKRQQLDEGSTIAGSVITDKSATYTGRTLRGDERRPSATTRSIDSTKSDMLTMIALENALRTNPIPLLQFAALKDFSGENVSFLTHVADWRRAWLTPKTSTADHHRDQFVSAVRIYAHFVSLDFSEFPINISSKEMKNLFNIFESAASLLFRRTSISSSSDSATPFNDVSDEAGSMSNLKSGANLDTLGRANFKAVSRVIGFGHEAALYDVEIPTAFTETVFDAAESEIKYLILTNTWPKFVHTGLDNFSQNDEEEKQPSWIKKSILCSA